MAKLHPRLPLARLASAVLVFLLTALPATAQRPGGKEMKEEGQQSEKVDLPERRLPADTATTTPPRLRFSASACRTA